MKNFLLALALFVCPAALAGITYQGTVTCGQSNIAYLSCNSAGDTSSLQSFGTASNGALKVAAGDAIVLGVGDRGGPKNYVVKDTCNQTWVPQNGASTGTGQYQTNINVWTVSNAQACPADSITVTYSPGRRNTGYVVSNYSGVESIGATAVQGLSRGAPTVSLTTQEPASVVVASMAVGESGSGNPVWTPVSGSLKATLNDGNLAMAGMDNTSESPALVTNTANIAVAPGILYATVAGAVELQSACGFPGYLCARNDWATEPLSSMFTTPPDAGPNHCVPGSVGDATHPGLQTCGNVLGLNTIVTEPDYNNARLVRATDYRDIQTGCLPLVGPGGSAGHNIFDKDANYFIVSCGGGLSKIKWFNPETQQVMTTANGGNDPLGYVHTSTGATLAYPTNVRMAYNTPGRYFVWSGTQVTSYQISNGVSGPGTVVADNANGIPCWTGSCPAWTPGTQQPGGNIIPTAAQGNIAPAHSFQLLNPAACDTGASAPNFAAAFGTLPKPASQMGVIDDGTCQWADMGAPPLTGGKIVTQEASGQSTSDTVFVQAYSLKGGQDGAGNCFLVVYDSVTDVYQHWNTCTGNVYNNQVFIGNTFSDPGNHFSAPANGMDIHNFTQSPDGKWGELGFNNCALVDVASGQPVLCQGPTVNSYQWTVGTTQLTDSKTWLGTGTPGHDMLGNNVEIYSGQTYYQPTLYLFKSRLADGAVGGFFDLSTPPASGDCTPNSCWVWNTIVQQHWVNALKKQGMDQHESWVSNQGSDDVPICMETYDEGSNIWPPEFPFYGEVVCFATDGSNRVTRQANAYNTQTSGIFNLQFNVGSLSPDGKWWAISTDWFCTLGDTNGNAINICGLPYSDNHTYAMGEYVGPIQKYSGIPGRIYQVVTAGTTSATDPANTDWCNTPGCTFTNGTAVFEYVGQQNAQPAVFLVKLQ